MKKSLRERIYLEIRDEITLGNLKPGERLTEDKLSKQFKASKTPIREALRQLESESLIVFERNRGITVSKLSIKQVKEIYGLRSLLEGYAARLFCERATEKDLAYLRDLHKSLERVNKAHSIKEWVHYNNLFHAYIIERTSNDNLNSVVDTLKRRVYRLSYIGATIPGKLDEYLKTHEKLIEACEKKDGDMAEKYMKRHIEDIKDFLIGILTTFPSLT